jgi:peroxiredoxin
MCSGSAPVLARLAAKAPVVAVYHPKPPRDVSPEQVRAWASEIGMPGALAIDRDGEVLRRWKAGKETGFTSLTFLLDRNARVRHVHPGGRIEAPEEEELRQRIDALLAEDR